MNEVSTANQSRDILLKTLDVAREHSDVNLANLPVSIVLASD